MPPNLKTTCNTILLVRQKKIKTSYLRRSARAPTSVSWRKTTSFLRLPLSRELTSQCSTVWESSASASFTSVQRITYKRSPSSVADIFLHSQFITAFLSCENMDLIVWIMSAEVVDVVDILGRHHRSNPDKMSQTSNLSSVVVVVVLVVVVVEVLKVVRVAAVVEIEAINLPSFFSLLFNQKLSLHRTFLHFTQKICYCGML